MADQCTHLGEVRDVMPRTPTGCGACMQMGDRWVLPRLCLVCGRVGCCDISRNAHAAKHFHAARHPAIGRFERGGNWGWCYMDTLFMQPAPGAR